MRYGSAAADHCTWVYSFYPRGCYLVLVEVLLFLQVSCWKIMFCVHTCCTVFRTQSDVGVGEKTDLRHLTINFSQKWHESICGIFLHNTCTRHCFDFEILYKEKESHGITYFVFHIKQRIIRRLKFSESIYFPNLYIQIDKNTKSVKCTILCAHLNHYLQ